VNQPAPVLLPPASGEGAPDRASPDAIGPPPSKAPPWVRWAVLALIAVGAAARIVQYLSGRALFQDEAFLWLNLSRRSVGALLGPLDYAQGAPVPFLLAERAVSGVLGDSEWALRLIPLACGLAALPLIAMVARRCLRPVEVPVAVGLIALAVPLIDYSSQFKQYSGDVAVALALTLLGLWAARVRLTAARTCALAAAGAAAVWLSDPAVFVLAGVGTTLLVAAWLGGERRRLAVLAGAGAAWLASFAALYLVHVPDLEAVRRLAVDDGAGSSSGGGNVLRTAAAGIQDPLGLPEWTAAPLIALMLLGAWSLWARRARLQLGLIAAPAAFTALAALLDRYPLGLRFDLFLAPSTALLAAAGVGAVWAAARGRARVIGPVLAAAVLAVPAVGAVGVLVSPLEHEELDDVLAQVAARRAPREVIYVQDAAQYAFAYYGPRAGIAVTPYDPRSPGASVPRSWYRQGVYPPALLSRPGLVIGRWSSDPARRVRDVDRVRGARRVWLVFSHSDARNGVDERDQMVRRALRGGRAAVWVRHGDAYAVLVERR
jgi:hypothetical protein